MRVLRVRACVRACARASACVRVWCVCALWVEWVVGRGDMEMGEAKGRVQDGEGENGKGHFFIFRDWKEGQSWKIKNGRLAILGS